MKKLTAIIVLLFTSTFYGQEVVVPIENAASTGPFAVPKVYFKDVNGVFDKFLATWKYESEGKTFQVTFYKRLKRDQGDISFTDEIYARFYYFDGESFVYNHTALNASSDFISGGTVINPNKLELLYSEPMPSTTSRDERQMGELYIEYQLNGGIQQLKWDITYVLSVNDPNPFKIPQNMILTKVN